MKSNLLQLTLLFFLISTTAFAQSNKKTASKSTNAVNTEHIGTWKLISQKVTRENGQVLIGDSTNVFQRKILTPTTFVVVIERRIPTYDNKKLAVSVAGGHYTLSNGQYEELTEYAAFKGFETMKVNYKLTMEDGKLHTVGMVSGSGIYDELYVREE